MKTIEQQITEARKTVKEAHTAYMEAQQELWTLINKQQKQFNPVEAIT